MFCRCAGTYLGEDSNVRVHAVCPSFVDTPLVKGKDGLDEYVAMAGGRSVPFSNLSICIGTV